MIIDRPTPATKIGLGNSIRSWPYSIFCTSLTIVNFCLPEVALLEPSWNAKVLQKCFKCPTISDMMMQGSTWSDGIEKTTWWSNHVESILPGHWSSISRPDGNPAIAVATASPILLRGPARSLAIDHLKESRATLGFYWMKGSNVLINFRFIIVYLKVNTSKHLTP